MKTVLQKKKILMPLLLLAAAWMPAQEIAAQKNVMCLKTNTNKYIECCRVSMIVVVDGGSTFDILTKDGDGAQGVSSISFEKHSSNIDLTKYGTGSDGLPYVDLTLPVWMQTSTGKNFKLANVSAIAEVDGRMFEVVPKSGANETGVRYVTFYRSKTEKEFQEEATAIDAVKEGDVEQLQLLTPVRSQLSLSCCGDAKTAVVYSLNGTQVGGAEVVDGQTTVYVGDLPAGVYVVKVGKKALKFTKQ